VKYLLLTPLFVKRKKAVLVTESFYVAVILTSLPVFLIQFYLQNFPKQLNHQPLPKPVGTVNEPMSGSAALLDGLF